MFWVMTQSSLSNLSNSAIARWAGLGWAFFMGSYISDAICQYFSREASLAIKTGATLEDMALVIHPHPTLSEGLMEAAEAAMGKAIHILNPK